MKAYLLLSAMIFVSIIYTTVNASEVTTYIDGDVMLKVYTMPNGGVAKREYYVAGTKVRCIKYKNNMIKVETLYDTAGKKVLVNKYIDNQVVKTVTYNHGVYESTKEMVA